MSDAGATSATLEGPHGPLTPEQHEAVERREGRLLVTANAGAGKTLVLVERFVREVVESAGTDDRIGPDGILAITFTRKAAGELRTRVRERFAALGEHELAREVERSWILTIDGFCLRVLRANAVLAGLDPAFGVLTDAPARELREQAFAEALERWLGGDAGPRTDALHVLSAHGYDGLRDAISEIHESLRNAGQAHPRIPPAAPREIPAAAAALAAAARAALAELGAITSPGKAVCAAIERIEACLGALDAGAATPGEVERWKPSRHGNALKTPALDACRAAADSYAQALCDAAGAPQLALVAELLDLYGAAFAALKRGADALDFTDLALRTRDLLLEHPAVAAGLRRRLRRVMVDEFQDTNALQLGLIEALGVSDVFLVGDALQSIYGFRHASVEVFEAERARREQAGEAAALTANFRSRKAILELVNAAFSGAHGSLGWNTLTVPPRGGRDEREPAAVGAAVELLITADDGWDEDTALRARLLAGLPAATRPALAAEALLVAQRVRELVDDGEAATGEIVVLVRAGTQLPLFERAIERAGLPAVAAQGRGWWARLEVLDLVAHLRAIANPADEEALLSALAAFAGAGPDTLALLGADRDAQRRAGERFATLRAALERAVSGAAPGFTDEERAQLGRWQALWERERAAAAWAGPSELLTRVVTATGYAQATLRRPGGARRLANVRKLVRLARDFEDRTAGDLRAFADHAAAELAANVPTSDAPLEVGADTAVRLMTAHAAKGLEFPVVVVADLGRRPPSSSPMILVDGDRAGLRVTTLQRERFSALSFAELKDERSARDRAEERRVIHVAVTRAERRLILSGVADPASLAEAPGAGKQVPALRWMGPLLLGAPVRERLGELVDEVVTLEASGHRAELRVAVNAPRTVGSVLRLGSAAGEPLQLSLEGLGGEGAVAAAGTRAGLVPGASGAGDDLWASLGDVPGAIAPPPTVSYSALTDYARCPYSWYLRRVLRLPPRQAWDLREIITPALGDRARMRGTIAHVLLERQALGAPAPGEAEVQAVVAELGAEPLQPEEVADQRALVDAFLDGPLHARVAAAAHVGREVSFALALDPADPAVPLLTGSIDLLATEDGGRALVVDYKTDHVDPQTDLDAAVAASYGLQRAAYALAALRGGAAEVDVVHLYLERPGAPVSATFASADTPALERQLLEATAGLLAGDFPVSERPFAGLCATCPGRHGLCSHPAELTDRELPQSVA